MTTMPIHVRVCIWVLGFYTQKALGQLIGSLEFSSSDCGQVIML